MKPGRLKYDAHSAQTASSVGSCSTPDTAPIQGRFFGTLGGGLEVAVLASWVENSPRTRRHLAKVDNFTTCQNISPWERALLLEPPIPFNPELCD